MLYRLGKGAARHKWWVIGIWVLALVGLAFVGRALPHATKDVFTIPGAESQKAVDLLNERFPVFSGPTATVVFHADSGKVTDADNAAAIESTVENITKLAHVSNVVDPTQAAFASFVSSDGSTSYSTVAYDKPIGDLSTETFDDLEKATEPATKAGLQVEFGGEVTDIYDPPNPGLSEYADEIGLLLALIILVISFGAVVAAGMPIGVALAALGTSTGVLIILEHFFTIGSINPIFGTMLGLGVGIDYSLLIVNRYLQDRHRGLDVPEAAGLAVATAGRAVLFAGFMICMATIALAVIGVPYVTTLGLTSAIYIGFTIVAALTLLPALLGLAGRHIESLALPWVKRRRARSDADAKPSFWTRWAITDRRRPWLYAGLGIIVLVLVAIPVKDAQLGFDNDGNLPESTTQRQAYDLLSDNFEAGVNGSLLIAIDLPGASSSDIDSDVQAATTLNTAIGKTDDVASSEGPIPNDDKTAAIIAVTPVSGPSTEATRDLVKELRDDVIPDSLKGTTLDASKVYVGGQTATEIDLDTQVESRLVAFIAVVLGGAFVLLLLVLRSILVPIKAVLLNLLTFLVSLGVITAVFQWGWGRSLLGVDGSAPIESFIPLILFAVLFGLSTDYEVFLVTRIREEYDRNGDPHQAVIDGVGSTGRVVASAALIMASVFLSFTTNTQILVKMIGLGLGLGILFDGLIVRLIVVPSLLQLMGRAAWWFPHWLDKLLPTIAIEGPDEATGDEGGDRGDGDAPDDAPDEPDRVPVGT
jgi:RND superfamily putative drug exporter